MKQTNQFVFILGPHRSGSSLVASALHSLGVNLGHRYIQPNDDNPKGFFEDEDIVRLNDRLLRSLNLSWDSFGFIWDQDFSSARLKPYHDVAVAMVTERFSTTKLAGMKDPRLCILLPFWKSVIAEALGVEVKYVLSIRVPEQCVRSQRTRHLRDSDFHVIGRRSIQTLLLWWTYLTKALKSVDPEHTVIVDYNAMVDAPELELRRLARLLDVELSQVDIDRFCVDHVEPLLNRSKQSGEVSRTQSPLLWDFADTLYSRLCSLSTKDTIAQSDFDTALEQLDTGDLKSLYLQELQFMNGYLYKKIVNIRHRLIQTIHEVGGGHERLAKLQENYESLGEQYRILDDQRTVLASEYTVLASQYQALDATLQMVLNTKGWRLLTFIRRFIPRSFF